MKLVDFDFQPELLQQFLDCPREIHAADRNWLPDSSETRQLSIEAHPSATWRNFLVFEGDRVLGRVTASINRLLVDESGQPYAQMGFFECVEDLDAARVLGQGAAAWLRRTSAGSRSILAPMNFDTWHSYRLQTCGFDEPSFLMEPRNPSYYPVLLTALGFEPLSRHVTKTVVDLPPIMRLWEPYYQRAVARGYRFRGFDAADPASEMSLVYRLSVAIFRQNPLYVDVSETEFRDLYSGIAGNLDPGLLVFVLDPAGEPLGFSFSMVDSRQPDTVNIKTFGILDRVHGRGIGAALAWESYRRFVARGCGRVNHCLMRVGNMADRLDRGRAQITREYSLYSRPLSP